CPSTLRRVGADCSAHADPEPSTRRPGEHPPRPKVGDSTDGAAPARPEAYRRSGRRPPVGPDLTIETTGPEPERDLDDSLDFSVDWAHGRRLRTTTSHREERSPVTHPEPIDSMVYPRYSGIATFMRLPHLTDTKNLDVVYVGVPFDTAAGYRVGARL